MIAALIVTYNPEHERLRKLLKAILPQVGPVIIVDNGSKVPVKDWIDAYTSDKIIWMPLGKNIGIAAAQNAGIQRAKTLNADHVILFDHDSQPASDMVAKLMEVVQKNRSSGEKIGIVGPRFLDSRQPAHFSLPHFIRLEGFMFRRVEYPNERPPSFIEVDFLISSGSLIPLSVFEEAGLMNEDLFIDHVDTEFSFRLKRHGFKCYGVPAAIMEHEIGDDTRRIFNRNAPMHSPLRHYYIIRNAVWIIRQPWMKMSWRIALAVNTFRRFIFYMLFASPRYTHTVMMLRGLRDGIMNRLGIIQKNGNR